MSKLMITITCNKTFNCGEDEDELCLHLYGETIMVDPRNAGMSVLLPTSYICTQAVPQIVFKMQDGVNKK